MSTTNRPVVLFEYGEDLGNGEISLFGFDDEPEEIWVQWKEDGLDDAREHAEANVATFTELLARFPRSKNELARLLKSAEDWVREIDEEELADKVAEDDRQARRVADARKVLVEAGEL
jgi:hypothetical protein